MALPFIGVTQRNPFFLSHENPHISVIQCQMTRNALKAINKEESDLVEELKQLAKAGADFDEEPLKNRAQSLINRRREISLILDDQNKYAIGIYHHLDQRIKDFGESSMFVQVSVHSSSALPFFGR